MHPATAFSIPPSHPPPSRNTHASAPVPTKPISNRQHNPPQQATYHNKQSYPAQDPTSASHPAPTSHHGDPPRPVHAPHSLPLPLNFPTYASMAFRPLERNPLNAPLVAQKPQCSNNIHAHPRHVTAANRRRSDLPAHLVGLEKDRPWSRQTVRGSGYRLGGGGGR